MPLRKLYCFSVCHFQHVLPHPSPSPNPLWTFLPFLTISPAGPWQIQVLESVPDINLLDYLPEILDGLFQILGDNGKEIRKM